MVNATSDFGYRNSEYYESKDPKAPTAKKAFNEFKAVILGSEIPLYLGSLGTLVRSVHEIAQTFFQALARFGRLISTTQITSAFTMPFDFHQFLMALYFLITTNDQEGRINAGLDALANISQLGDGVSTFTSMIASLSDKTITWAAPLGLAASLLSSIFVFINGRTIHFNRLILKDLKQSEKTSLAVEDFLVKHQLKLKRYAGIDHAWIKTKLKNREIVKLSEEQSKAVYKLLKERIYQKQISLSLGITITLIGIIATTTLFITSLTFLGLAANTLLISLAILSIAKMIYDRYTEKTFREDLRVAIKPVKISLVEKR